MCYFFTHMHAEHLCSKKLNTNADSPITLFYIRKRYFLFSTLRVRLLRPGTVKGGRAQDRGSNGRAWAGLLRVTGRSGRGGSGGQGQGWAGKRAGISYNSDGWQLARCLSS